ncbi:MFS transporter [uncultured Methanobrevibacter sp.]|uniref:MFS transporter n=1 Tax=uncultured Methanobrevibacter sp. TaxID=253161 RepID=UPI0025F34690|nr:MFS transporter [uncultured Methanobrevibacter sp.]
MGIVNKLGLEKSVILLAAVVSYVGAFLANISVALPLIARELAMSNILQNWVATIFLLSIAALSIPLGKLTSKYGLKKSLLIGIIFTLIGVIISCFSNTSYMLLFSRVVQGIGIAIINVASMALIVSAVPPETREQALGLNIAGVYIGLSSAPVIGGFVIYYLGWQSVFYVMLPFLLVSAYLCYALDDEWTMYDGSIDKLGSLIYMFGILLFVYGFTIINTSLGIILLVIGLALLICFAYIELRIDNPIFEVRLFKNARFSSSNLASLISYLATFVITYIVTYHFQYIMGLDSQMSGLLLIVTPVMMAIIAPISGRISDKIDPQKLAAIGMGFVTVAILILCFLDETTPLYLIIIAMFLQGLGYGLFSTPNTNAIMSSVPKEETGTASASLAAMRVIGQTLSIGLLTVIFAYIMGNVPIVPENYPLLMASSRISCIVSAILCVIAVCASLVGLRSDVEYET